MEYKKAYMMSHDIDWFCQINGIWISCASFGGLLPELVNDVSMLSYFQAIYSSIPFINRKDEIIYNEKLLQNRYERYRSKYRSFIEATNRINQEPSRMDTYEIFKRNYIDSFTDMARRGFYAYARINIDDMSDNVYHLVAKPTEEGSKILTGIIESFISSPIISNQFRNFVKNLNTANFDQLTFNMPLSF